MKQTKNVKFPHWNGYKAFSLLCTHPSSSTLPKGFSPGLPALETLLKLPQARSSLRFFLALIFR